MAPADAASDVAFARMSLTSRSVVASVGPVFGTTERIAVSPALFGVAADTESTPVVFLSAAPTSSPAAAASPSLDGHGQRAVEAGPEGVGQQVVRLALGGVGRHRALAGQPQLQLGGGQRERAETDDGEQEHAQRATDHERGPAGGQIRLVRAASASRPSPRTWPVCAPTAAS